MARNAIRVFTVRQFPFNTYHTNTAFLVTPLCTYVVLLAAGILSGTGLGTPVLQTDHSFYISHSEALFYVTANMCHFLPRVGGQASEFCMYHKLAKEEIVNTSCQLK